MKYLHIVICLILVNSNLCVAEVNYYESVQCVEPHESTVKEYTINSEFKPTLHLKQRGFGTCYAYSAYYLLQYHYNYSIRNQGTLQPSLLHVAGVGNHGELKEGGEPFSILHRVKNQDIHLVDPSHNEDFDKMMFFSQFLEEFNQKSCSTSNYIFGEVFRKSPILELVNDIDQIWTEEQFKNLQSQAKTQKELPYLLLSELYSNDSNVIKFEPYNIQVFERTLSSSDSSLRAVKDEVKTYMQKLFNSDPAYPVALNFCVKTDDPTSPSCSRNHSVAVTGVRTRSCLKNNEIVQVSEWQIHDSNLDETKWFNADLLSESVIRHAGNITSISPCVKNVDCKEYILGTSPVRYLSVLGDTQAMKTLFLEEKIQRDLNSRNHSFLTPLEIAIIKDDLKTVKLLAKQKSIELNSENPETGMTPLELAIFQNQPETVKALLQNRSLNINRRSSKTGRSPLVRAVATRNLEIVTALISFGADANLADGLTPLMLAIFEGDIEIVNALIKGKASVNKSFGSMTPLVVAIDEGHREIVNALVKAGALIDRDILPLKAAVSHGDCGLVSFLVGYSKDSTIKEFVSFANKQGNEQILKGFRKCISGF